MIDVDLFLNTEVHGANETKFVPVPVGEYIAMIPQGGLKSLREMQRNDGETAHVLDILWQITDEAVLEKIREITGMKEPTVKQSIFLDVVVNPDGKVVGLAAGPGKNVQLGRLREALNQNDPRKKWNFHHLEGAVARVKVEHTISSGETYAQVARKDGVTKL